MPERVAMDGRAGTMPWPEGRGKNGLLGDGTHWDGGSNEETTTVSGGRDRGCESADSQDAVGGRPLLDPGLISGFEKRLFVDHGEDVRSPSLTNGSPEARKDCLVPGRCATEEMVGCISSYLTPGDETETTAQVTPNRYNLRSAPFSLKDAIKDPEKRLAWGKVVIIDKTSAVAPVRSSEGRADHDNAPTYQTATAEAREEKLVASSKLVVIGVAVESADGIVGSSLSPENAPDAGL